MSTWFNGLPSPGLSRDGSNSFWFEGLPYMDLSEGLVISMLVGKRRLLSLHPVDALGNPKPLDEVPNWHISDSLVASLSVPSSPFPWDGMSVYLNGVAPGTATLTVQGSSQGNLLQEIVEVEVADLPAVSLGLTIGDLEN